jgi:hypothetical protein
LESLGSLKTHFLRRYSTLSILPFILFKSFLQHRLHNLTGTV